MSPELKNNRSQPPPPPGHVTTGRATPDAILIGNAAIGNAQTGLPEDAPILPALNLERLPRVPERKALTGIAIVLLLLLIAGAITFLLRARHTAALAQETGEAAIPAVAVVHPKLETPDQNIGLPATLQGFRESPIYARTSGYLAHWYKDIGSHVRKGELLARLDTPEVDQELAQARAARQQVQAQMELAKSTSDRWAHLLTSDSVSQQEADQQANAYKQAVANVAASDANVRRLQELESFKNIYAPFAGVITKRTVDEGALINAGAGATGKELFDLAQVDPIRVFVNVPQAYAAVIRPGTKAWLTLQEFPGRKFAGAVARNAGSIDPATRTLTTEVDVPNRAGELLPGSYGQVGFQSGSAAQGLTLPVNAVLFRAEGVRVAVVDGKGKVSLRPITIGRDYGATLEVLGGVSADDWLIINPSDSVSDGQTVRVVSPGSEGGTR